jgi:hypothetical protein
MCPSTAERGRKQPQDANDGLFQWAVVGTQRISVMGYTSGGLPYGLTQEECDKLCDDYPPQDWRSE